MKRVIRRGVFETNSSSVHSLTMCSDEDYKAWEKGEKIWYDEMLWDIEELKDHAKHNWTTQNIDDLTEEEWKEFCKDWGALTFDGMDDYVDRCCYEWFEEEYTTQKGEVIHAFGYYGHD